MLAKAKAWAATVGAIVTALIGLGIIPVPYQTVLALISAVCTGIVTYAVPNIPSVEDLSIE